MDSSKIFHSELINNTIEICNRLVNKDESVFRPRLVEELGFDPKSQEAACLVSLMFQMSLVTGFKLAKGKNGGIKRLDETKEVKEASERKCGRCGKTGHNARTCKEEIVENPVEPKNDDATWPTNENDNEDNQAVNQ